MVFLVLTCAFFNQMQVGAELTRGGSRARKKDISLSPWPFNHLSTQHPPQSTRPLHLPLPFHKFSSCFCFILQICVKHENGIELEKFIN